MGEFKFLDVYCSNCGQGFGPGDNGFSHCENHAGMYPQELGTYLFKSKKPAEDLEKAEFGARGVFKIVNGEIRMIEFEILFETLHRNLEIAREALAVKRWDNAAIAFEHVEKVAGVAARAVVREARAKEKSVSDEEGSSSDNGSDTTISDEEG